MSAARSNAAPSTAASGSASSCSDRARGRPARVLKTLNRACRRATGHTAKQLIDTRVTLEAKRLLAHSDVPVAAVSHRLGFTEPTNFSKFFTRATGRTPGAFRDTQR